MGIREAIGRLAQDIRYFRPEGPTFLAEVVPLVPDDPAEIGRRLSGTALVAMSKPCPGILGCAIRFGWDERRLLEDDAAGKPREGDQDLLFASLRTSFTANTYIAAIPFEIRGAGRLKFRLVRAGAVLRLDIRPAGRPGAWRPAAEITLLREVRLPPRTLAFSPFVSGAGIRPRGLPLGLRWANSLGSRAASRAHGLHRKAPSSHRDSVGGPMENREIAKKLDSLVHLDIDAIHAYDQAIEKVDHVSIRQQLQTFKADHERHVRELSAAVRQLGEEPPAFKPDFKGYMIRGFTALRSVTGTEGALKAMRSNEKLTTSTYEDAVKWELPGELMQLIQRNRDDERRHLSYVERALEEKIWTQGKAA